MKILAPSFSPQYLKQVHDEWLYVQATQGCRNSACRESNPGPGRIADSYYARHGTDRDLRSHNGQV